ncbi:MAG: FixH family protein [Chloroflexota bacterium]
MARQARSWLTFLLLVGGLVLTACRQAEPPDAQAAGIEIAVTMEPDPPVTGAATLWVSVRNEAGEPVRDAKLNVRGDMTHAGMVPVIRDIEESEDGVFVVPFEWTMSGDWIVDFTVTLPDGETAQERLDITVAPGENEPEGHDAHADHDAHDVHDEHETPHDG